MSTNYHQHACHGSRIFRARHTWRLESAAAAASCARSCSFSCCSRSSAAAVWLTCRFNTLLWQQGPETQVTVYGEGAIEHKQTCLVRPPKMHGNQSTVPFARPGTDLAAEAIDLGALRRLRCLPGGVLPLLVAPLQVNPAAQAAGRYEAQRILQATLLLREIHSDQTKRLSAQCTHSVQVWVRTSKSPARSPGWCRLR